MNNRIIALISNVKLIQENLVFIPVRREKGKTEIMILSIDKKIEQ